MYEYFRNQMMFIRVSKNPKIPLKGPSSLLGFNNRLNITSLRGFHIASEIKVPGMTLFSELSEVDGFKVIIIMHLYF